MALIRHFSLYIGLVLLTCLFLTTASFSVVNSAEDMHKSEKKLNAVETITLVDKVDVNKYMGKWYEIASIPMFFQRKCVKNTRAVYTLLDNGKVKVDNSCGTENGKRIQSIGQAKIVDKGSNAKLKVTFANLFGWYIYAFGGDYWIIDLDKENYQYAIVGHPSRKYGWILSRTPDITPETLGKLKTSLSLQGYNSCDFKISAQDGGFQKELRLCDWSPS